MQVNDLFSYPDKVRFRVREVDGEFVEVDARDLHYKDLNSLLRSFDRKGVYKVRLLNVEGQRYIGTGLKNIKEIVIHGTPGNDLGAFMRGQGITVYGNVQDGCGNTMNGGEIIVHGSAGDILGYAMRDGKIVVKGDAGYRAGIHMKEYRNQRPIIAAGGSAGDFLGEYMAGGILVVLGLNLRKDGLHRAKYVGTGMHGGVIYIHGEVKHKGKEVAKLDLSGYDRVILEGLIREFSNHFNLNPSEVIDREYYKLLPLSKRPYGQLYVY